MLSVPCQHTDRGKASSGKWEADQTAHVVPMRAICYEFIEGRTERLQTSLSSSLRTLQTSIVMTLH